MNCESAKQAILLNQSGELPGGEAEELGRHLVGCSDCRRYEAEIPRINAAANKALLSGEPSAAVMLRILTGDARSPAAKPVVLYLRALRLTATAAGVVMLITGGYLGLTAIQQNAAQGRNGKMSSAETYGAAIAENEQNAAQAQSDRMSHVRTIVATIAENDAQEDEADALAGTPEDLNVLADQLLRADGFLTDEFPEDEGTAMIEELPTRDLQSRSISCSLPGGCV